MARRVSTVVGGIVLALASIARAQPGVPPPAGPGAAPPAITGPASPDPGERIRAATELALDPSATAVGMLITLLQRDIDARVRASAATALADRGDAELAEVLELAAERDPDPSVRLTARSAYERTWPLGKRPGTAGAFGLIPGLGHLYLRQRGEGLAYLGTAAALFGTGLYLLSDASAASITDPTMRDADDPIGFELLMAGQNLMFYSSFDAYRDARVMHADRGYARPITRETLPELATAPFRPSVLASPWVWIGVPVALGLGLGVEYAVAKDEISDTRHLTDGGGVDFLGRHYGTAAGFGLGELYFGGLFLPVGIGEESMFRGVIQTSLGEKLGPWGGWAVASLIFGAVHIANFTQAGANAEDALVAVPFITAVGSTLGLAYMKNGYQLSTSVAMHFWYDFLLSTAAFVVDPDDQPFTARLRLTL